MADAQATPVGDDVQAERANRAERAAYMREYRKKNPEKFKAIDGRSEAKKKAADIGKHKAAMKARSRRAYERKKANPPAPMTPEELADWKRRRSEANRKWREKAGEVQKEKERARSKAQYHANREKHLGKMHAKRCQMSESGEVTTEQWEAIKAAYGNACAYCRRKVKLEMDHVQALTKGGPHVPENVVPACRHCNTSKGNGDRPKSLPPELRV